MKHKSRQISMKAREHIKGLRNYMRNIKLYDDRQQAYTNSMDHMYHYRGVSRAEIEDFNEREVLGKDHKESNTSSVVSHLKEANNGSNMLSFTPSPYSAGNFANKFFTNPFTTRIPGVTQTAVFRTSYSLIMVDIKDSNGLLCVDDSEVLFSASSIDGCMADVDLQSYEDGQEDSHNTVKSYANSEAEWAQVNFLNGYDFRMNSEDVESIAHLVGMFGLPQFYNVNDTQINAEFAPMGFSVIIPSPCAEEEKAIIEQAEMDAESDKPSSILGNAIKWKNQRPITSIEGSAAALAVKGIFKRLPYANYEKCGTDLHRTVPADIPSHLTTDYLVEQHKQFRSKVEVMDDENICPNISSLAM